MERKDKISIQNILDLNPTLSAIEDIYLLKTEDGSIYYLEVYANSDYGLEYTFYNSSYDDIDGGVVDDVEFDNPTSLSYLLLSLIEEIHTPFIHISKLPFQKEKEIEGEEETEDVLSFREKVEKRWKEKVEKLKKEMKK